MKTMGVSLENMGVWKLCVCVWKSSFGLECLDTWFGTLSLVYGLETPNLISC